MTKLLLVLVSFLVYVNARHLNFHADKQARPHDVEEIWANDVENANIKEALKEEYVNVEVPEEVHRTLKTNRFVPLNNAVFFMGNLPCAEEGYKRDYLGICREVWD